MTEECWREDRHHLLSHVRRLRRRRDGAGHCARGARSRGALHHLPATVSAPRLHAGHLLITKSTSVRYPLFEYPPYDLALAVRIHEVVRITSSSSFMRTTRSRTPRARGLRARCSRTRAAPCRSSRRCTARTSRSSGRIPRSARSRSSRSSDPMGSPPCPNILRRETISTFGCNQCKVEVIHNFIDPLVYDRAHGTSPCFASRPAKGSASSSTCRTSGRSSACAMSSRIFAGIQREIPSVLFMVGDGPDRTEAEEEARLLGVERSVFFLGKLDIGRAAARERGAVSAAQPQRIVRLECTRSARVRRPRRRDGRRRTARGHSRWRHRRAASGGWRRGDGRRGDRDPARSGHVARDEPGRREPTPIRASRSRTLWPNTRASMRAPSRRAVSAALRLVRWANALIAAAGVLIGAWWAGWGDPSAIALTALAAVGLTAAANAWNDIADVDIDRLAHPERPLVTRELSLDDARPHRDLRRHGCRRVRIERERRTRRLHRGRAVGHAALQSLAQTHWARRVMSSSPCSHRCRSCTGATPRAVGRAAFRSFSSRCRCTSRASSPRISTIATADRGARRTLPLAAGVQSARIAIIIALGATGAALDFGLAPLVKSQSLLLLALAPAMLALAFATARALRGRPGSPVFFKLAMVCAMAALLVARA